MRQTTLRPMMMVGWLIFLFLAACQPAKFPTTTPPPPTLTATPPGGLSLDVNPNPLDVTISVGSSMSYGLNLGYPEGQAPQVVNWETQYVPDGIKAEFKGHTTPWATRLLVTTDPKLTVGPHTFDVVATTGDNQFARVGVTVNVTECIQSEQGRREDSINLNLVGLITAGKPAVEHGLLVPVQVCDGPKHIQVILKEEKAEDLSVMNPPMPFYLFRSEVYPEPDNIMAHGIEEAYNVQVPNITQTNTTTELNADVPPGLYLLIFEHDRYGATLTPGTRPSYVTYELHIN